jgi:hypothetical protein
MLSSQELSFDLRGEDFVIADLVDRPNLESVLVCRNGKVILIDLDGQSMYVIGRLSFYPGESSLQIHAFGDFVCITQKYGTAGNIFNLADSNYRKVLERGDYCASVSQFPITFYERIIRQT